MGAWIEIYGSYSGGSTFRVAPLVGAWIEISNQVLKNVSEGVAPLVGVWIEICGYGKIEELEVRRSPCGSVD